MATMFTVKDLEVYKDSLKEKKDNTKPAEKPAKSPPSVAKVPKPSLKPNNEESHRARKPLSVVHKSSSNTIKDPQKPHSLTPAGSSKQADQWRKIKEAASKNPLPGKIHTVEANSLPKSSEFKTETPKSPTDALPPKPPHVKLDTGKASGVRKSSTLASPVNHKSSSLSGAAKAPPTIDANASLCSECTRSASEGAVCFIGNDGRVSACSTRSAVRLCKNLNCAANNPEYVAAMANAPKKYLISKRHLLKAQFGPKSKTGRPKSPNVHQMDASGDDGMTNPQDAVSPSFHEPSPLYADVSGANSSASEADDGDLSLLEGSLNQFDEELSLSDGNLDFDKDGMGLRNSEMYSVEEVAVEEPIDFSFQDGDAAEVESPKLLIDESPKDLNEMHLAGSSDDFQEDCGASDNLHEDAESLAIDNFDEEHDDEDLDGSPMHRESKAEELSINYGDASSEEADADADDPSGNEVGFILGSRVGDNLDVSITEGVSSASLTVHCEDAGEGNQIVDRSSQDAESCLESNPQPSTSVGQGAVDHLPILEDKQLPEQLADKDNDGCDTARDAGQPVDDVNSGDSTTITDILKADDNQKGSDLYDDQRVDDVESGDLTTRNNTPSAHDNQKGSDISEDFKGSPQKGSDISEDLEDSGDPASPFIANDHQDNSMVLLVLDGGSGATPLNDTQVDDNEVDITSLHGTSNEQRDDHTASWYDNKHVESDESPSGHGNGHAEKEDQSEGDFSDDDQPDAVIDYSEDDQPDAVIRNSNSTEDNVHVDRHEDTEHSLDERISKKDCIASSTSARRQRRRVLVPEEVSPETVILRKQQMLERKQAEEWLLNHAIEGAVHKLAPTGEAKVKILVEAFESIMSHTDVEGIDTHNPRQEKPAAVA